MRMVKQKMEPMEHRPFSKKEANDGFGVETLESLIKMVSQPSFCEFDINVTRCRNRLFWLYLPNQFRRQIYKN